MPKRKGNLDKVGRDPKTGRFTKATKPSNPKPKARKPVGPKSKVQPKPKPKQKREPKTLGDDVSKMIGDVLDDLQRN